MPDGRGSRQGSAQDANHVGRSWLQNLQFLNLHLLFFEAVALWLGPDNLALWLRRATRTPHPTPLSIQCREVRQYNDVIWRAGVNANSTATMCKL